MSGIFSKAIGLNGLSYRLLSYILICSTVLAMIITVLQLAWDYNKEVTVIEDSDNGRGIPPEILPRIFDPFVTSKRGNGGSGLDPTSSTTWWRSCCAVASTAPVSWAKASNSISACPSSRTELRPLWAGAFVPIML